MAENLPDTLALREIKYGDRVPPAKRAKVAQALFEAGRVHDALDLYLINNDEEGIRKVRRHAVERGLPVLLLMLRRAGHVPEPAEWSAAAEKALAAGRFREAFRCFREAQDEAGLERVRNKLPDYDLYTPQGK